MPKKNDPIAISVPIPRGLLELAGDFKNTLATSKNELEQINRKLATLGDITGPPTAGQVRLMERRKSLQEQIQEVQDKQAWIDDQRSSKEHSQRMSRQFLSDLERIQAKQVASAMRPVEQMRGAIDRTQRTIQVVSDLAEGRGGMIAQSLAQRALNVVGGAGPIGAAVAAGAAIGMEVGGYFVEEFNRKNEVRLQSSRTDVAFFRQFQEDLYGTRYTAEYERDVRKRMDQVAAYAGSSQHLGLFDKAVSWWTGGKSESMKAAADAKEQQLRVERFVRQFGNSWRTRLNAMTVAGEEGVRRQIDWEEKLDPYKGGIGGAATGLYRSFVDNLTAGWSDPREGRALEIARERVDKRMTDLQNHYAAERERVENHPEYMIANQYRSIQLRAWESYVHERYLQWNPF
jgi:hypothetical protein